MNIDRITSIYDEIAGYSIELDADPTVLGPQYLGRVIAQCRNYLNRTTSILLEIRRDKQMTANRLAGEKAAFDIASDELLATDERVRARPNIRDREALIKVILKERVNRIHELENDLRNLDAIESAVKVRHNELVRTDSQIKTQRSLIRDELDTKSFYGDEESSSRRRVSDINEDELEALMNEPLAPTTSPTEPSADVFTPPVVNEVPAPDSQPEQAAASTTESQPEPAPAPEPEKPKAPEIDVDAALALAQEVQEAKPEEAPSSPEPSQASNAAATPVSDDVADIEKFLNAEPDKATKETKGKKGGRRSTPKEESIQSANPTAGEDPDFADILASL